MAPLPRVGAPAPVGPSPAGPSQFGSREPRRRGKVRAMVNPGRTIPFAALGLCLLSTGILRAAEPPVIPVGADAYLRWEQWPYQRIGARAYMRSTYDRLGGNEGADASHYLYQLRDDFNATLDVAGPGVLYFVRYNHWHGSPWHYEVDGTDHLVAESNTPDPCLLYTSRCV